MNELEERLRSLLLDATADTAAPARMLRDAACRAAGIQRRRRATAGALSVAALAAGGVVAWGPGDGPAGQLDYIASAAPSPPTVAATEPLHVTLVHTMSCDGASADSTTVCHSLALSVDVRGSGASGPTRLVTDAGRYPPPVAKELIVVSADGSEHHVAARAEGSGRWSFDTELPAGAEYVVAMEHDARNRITVRVSVCSGSVDTCERTEH
jgi:hypothetical protein